MIQEQVNPQHQTGGTAEPGANDHREFDRILGLLLQAAIVRRRKNDSGGTGPFRWLSAPFPSAILHLINLGNPATFPLLFRGWIRTLDKVHCLQGSHELIPPPSFIPA
jgi:hypothetical protein